MATPKHARPLRRRSFLLVRHGQTPTTGKILPGRAPGLHLAEAGQAQAERGGRADRRADAGRRRLRLATRARPRDGGADRQGARG